MTEAGSWRAAISEYIRREARPQDKFGHQPRLYALTQKLGTGLSYDDDIVYAAAWLHDLGVFIGHRPEDPGQLTRWDHVAYVCEKTPAILTEIGFPAEKIPAVLDAIRTHQPKDNPTTTEAMLLRDSDILEQLGAIGILRTTAKVGRDTRFQNFAQVHASLKRSLDELPGKLRLASARAAAEKKVALLHHFLQGMEEEGVPSLE